MPKNRENLAHKNRENFEVSRNTVDANKKVEHSVQADVVVDSVAEANRLFDLMNKDLREKRKQAKAEGKSESEIKAIKFDKTSANFKKWELACDENQLDELDRKLSKLQPIIDDCEKNGKRIPDEISNEFSSLIRRVASVNEVKRLRNSALETIDAASQKRDEIAKHAEVLGDTEQSHFIQAVSEQQGIVDVAEAQISLMDQVSRDPEFTVPPEIPADYVEEKIRDAEGFELEEIVDEFVPNSSDVNAGETFFEQEQEGDHETSDGGKGVELIKAYFVNELSDDAKAKIGSREAIFTVKLNKFVGDDKQFADLLLRDDNFVKSVDNFFGANMIGPGNKFLERAAQFTFTLELARSIYDKALDNKTSVETGEEIEADEIEEVEEEYKESDNLQKTKAEFYNLEKFGIETPKQLKARINTLNSDLKTQISDLLANQDSLAQCSWYQLNKKGLIKDKIKENLSQIGDLKNVLIDLGGTITAAEVKYNSKDFEEANRDLAAQIKQLKNEKVDSKGLFDKYADLGVALLAAFTVVTAVAEAGREKHFKADEKPAAMKMAETNNQKIKVENLNTTPRAVSSEKPVVDTKNTPTGDTVKSGETAKPQLEVASEKAKVTKEAHKKHKKNKAESKKPAVDEFADYGAKVEDFERRITSQFNYIQTLKEYGAKNDKPVLDIARMSDKEIENLKNDPSSAMWTGNTIAENEKKLDALRNELKDYSTRYHQSVIDKEDKIVTSKPEKLDLSYLAERGNMNDLADDEDLSFKASPFYGRELAGAHNILRTVLEFSRDTNDAAKLKNYVSDVNKALRVYKQSFDEAHHPINAYTKNQYELGKKSSETIIAELQKAIRENRAPSLSPVRNGGKAFDRNALMRAEIEKKAQEQSGK